jgi:hypothetical protein
MSYELRASVPPQLIIEIFRRFNILWTIRNSAT